MSLIDFIELVITGLINALPNKPTTQALINKIA